MKIGVFGDSFADAKLTDCWFNLLASDHGHTVKSFGLGGTSIMYSAKLVDIYASQFDLVIWALTESDRHTLQVGSRIIPLLPGSSAPSILLKVSDELPIGKFHAVYQDYMKYLFSRKDADFGAQCIVNSMMTTHQNILILPCFPNPVHTEFSLMSVSEMESQCYFPNQSLSKVWEQYRDLRQGHITAANHAVLARYINDNLEPGILRMSLDKFVAPGEPLSQLFQ
jgi:hypothetical protein